MGVGGVLCIAPEEKQGSLEKETGDGWGTRKQGTSQILENLAYILQVRMNVEVPTNDDGAFMENIENVLKHQTLSTICSDEDALCFFLRHVEHVIMRCVRLHYCFQDEFPPAEKSEGEEVEECAA